MNCSAAIQVLPFDTEKGNSKDSIYRIVDSVIEYIRSTGVSYEVGAFETSLEGDFDKIMNIIKTCQEIAVKAGADYTLSYVKILYKPESPVATIEEKVSKHR